MSALGHGLSLGRDADGRPVARAGGDGDTAELARFLNSDVPDADHAEDLATQADRGGPADLTGNAYAVTIGADAVILTHLHIPGRIAVAFPRDAFAAALRAWGRFLREE